MLIDTLQAKKAGYDAHYVKNAAGSEDAPTSTGFTYASWLEYIGATEKKSQEGCQLM